VALRSGAAGDAEQPRLFFAFFLAPEGTQRLQTYWVFSPSGLRLPQVLALQIPGEA
jgi:hypothetical protein